MIRKVTFTGSTAVGKQLAALAGLHMKRSTMELGGHARRPRHAHVQLAVMAAGAAKLRMWPGLHLAHTLLVHNSVREEFTRAMVAHAEALKVGNGLQYFAMARLANPRRVTALTSRSRTPSKAVPSDDKANPWGLPVTSLPHGAGRCP